MSAHLDAFSLEDYLARTQELKADAETLRHELDLLEHSIETREQYANAFAGLRDALRLEPAEFDLTGLDCAQRFTGDGTAARGEPAGDDEDGIETSAALRSDQDDGVVVPLTQVGFARRRGQATVHDQILGLFRQQPEKAWAPNDVIPHLGIVNADYVRTVMRRMARSGELAQPRRGLYQVPAPRRRMNG